MKRAPLCIDAARLSFVVNEGDVAGFGQSSRGGRPPVGAIDIDRCHGVGGMYVPALRSVLVDPEANLFGWFTHS